MEIDHTTTDKKRKICQTKGSTNFGSIYVRKILKSPRILSMPICNSYLRKGNWEKD
jgi:hypothetical protein